MSTPIIYPFDPYGLEASNLITNERHAISPPAWADYYFIIPKLAPFFRDSVKIVHEKTGKQLVEGVDWVATHLFRDASRACAKSVYGSITFYDKTLSGIVRLEYQTLGGEWVIDTDTITEIMANAELNPRITTWEQIVNVPDRFPVIDHEWHLDDMVGLSEVREAIDGISSAINAAIVPDDDIETHVQRRNNPHDVTKAQVGLGQVRNYPVASVQQARDGLSDEVYMTPAKVREAIEALGHTHTQAHASRRDNPHGVTKEQIGLGQVENYPVSTLQQAVDGVHHASIMTPLRVKQSIEANASDQLKSHVANGLNPHGVDKAQVGLGQVKNYPIASVAQAQAGGNVNGTASNVVYMTPERTRNALAVHSESAHHDERYYTKTESNGRFVRKNTSENTSIKTDGSRVYIYANGGWRQVFPAQWA